MARLTNFRDLKEEKKEIKTYRTSLFSLKNDYGFAPKKEIRRNSLMLEMF